MEFRSWPKTPRLFGKPMYVEEKLDGTNACAIVQRLTDFFKLDYTDYVVEVEGEPFVIGAQSRNRALPMKARGMDDLMWRKQDNAGFAAWVRENAEALVTVLGEGYHYGEWYGKGIQRGYGLSDRRFALFNSHRWGFLADPDSAPNIPGLVVVPTVYVGQFDTEVVRDLFNELMEAGSQAVPGFMQPEGLIIYHMGNLYKMTDNGDKPKYVIDALKAAA